MDNSHKYGQMIALSTATVFGLSFWFFLGFPFANHNESFVLVGQLARMNLPDILTTTPYPVANYRPLGQAIAWLGYTAAGGSTYMVQLFNYAVAVLSWLMLLFITKEKKVFSLISLCTGAVMFSGYVYLFHLHGVFYSPMLFLIAVSFLLCEGTFTGGKFILLSAVSFVIALFHPYALLMYLGAALGLVVERRKEITRAQYVMVAVLVMAAIAFAKLLTLSSREQGILAFSTMISGLLASYQTVEVNVGVSIVALFLTGVTVFSMSMPVRTKAVMMFSATAVSCLLWLAGLPVVIVWVVVCLAKMIIMQQWKVAFLIGVTSLFPAPAATGSPTYCIFVLMVCVAATALGWTTMENAIRFPDTGVVLAVAMAGVVCVVGLRSGVRLPIVSHLTRPILAEREKTIQMETIVNWMLQSAYQQYTLRLKKDASNPTAIREAVDRTHRPPTSQEYLNAYVNSLRSLTSPDTTRKLIVTFGSDRVEKGNLVYAVESKHADTAFVYVPPR